MTRLLVLFLREDPNARIPWTLIDRTDARAAGRGDWSTTQPRPTAWGEADGLIALGVAPGACVFARAAASPGRSPEDARKAAAFMFEEEIASEPEALHWAVGAAGDDGRRPVRAVDRALASHWRSTLSACKAARAHLVCDFDLHRVTDDHREIWPLFDGRAVVSGRDGPHFSGDAAWVSKLLETPEMRDRPIRCAHPEVVVPIGVTVECADPPSDREIARRCLSAPDIATDLLQGAMRLRSKTASALKEWRLPLALAAAAAVVFTASYGVVIERNFAAAARLEADAERAFREAYPDVRRIVNLRAQARARARLDAIEGSDYLSLMGVLAAAVERTPEVGVDFVRYDAETGELSATLGFPNYEAVGVLRAAVEAEGGSFAEGALRREEGLVSGDIVVRRR